VQHGPAPPAQAQRAMPRGTEVTRGKAPRGSYAYAAACHGLPCVLAQFRVRRGDAMSFSTHDVLSSPHQCTAETALLATAYRSIPTGDLLQNGYRLEATPGRASTAMRWRAHRRRCSAAADSRYALSAKISLARVTT